jgi:MFS family permease
MAGLAETFRSLKYRNFKLYFIGQSVSLIGTWMDRIAINWLVYTVSHSALMLGIVNFAGQIPTLLLSPYGGAISDRHDRYKILLITQIAAMVEAGLMAVLVFSHFYNMYAIIALSVMLGVINAFDTPSRQSLMVRLIEDKKDLQNAIALNSSMVNLARMVGPAAAGILLTTVGTGFCFLLNSVSFIAVIVCLMLMELPAQQKTAHTQSIWEGLVSGYNYLKGQQNIKLVILLMACVSFFVMSYTTLMPVMAKDIFHGTAATFSALNSISGLGALCGAIYMAGLKSTKNLRRTLVYTSAFFSLAIAVFALSGYLWLALFFMFLAGIAVMMHIAGTNTYVQTKVSDQMRGRVLSYYVVAFLGMQPLGNFCVGLAAHYFGARPVLFVEGIAGLVIAVLFSQLFKKTGKVGGE